MPDNADGERKLVTVLFADIKSSMELIADRDPEEARSLLDPVLDTMVSAVHEYDGTVNQVMGDGIMALFGAPRAQEDHALRACYAALSMKEAMRHVAANIAHDHGVFVQIRIGLNSGDVVVRSIGSDIDADYTAVGQATHIAARLEHIASPGNILATAATVQLAEGFVETGPMMSLQVKGLGSSLKVYELLAARSVQTRSGARAFRVLPRFVARNAEIALLDQARERSTCGRGQVVGVSGEAGIGKSRLLSEFAQSDRMHGWFVLKTGAFSHTAKPLVPLITLCRTYFSSDNQEPGARRGRPDGGLEPTLLEFIAASTAHSHWDSVDARHGREFIGTVRRLLLRESQIQPVCLVFEDLHWVDFATKEFLDSLVDSLRTANILLLVDYRPGYRHGWEGKPYCSTLTIDPLADDVVDELLIALLGEAESVAALRKCLRDGARGNPLFLEEAVREMIASGLLVGSPGAYHLTAPLERMIVPASVQAVLASKIDRLSPLQKQVVGCASVMGDAVPYSVLQNITDASRPTLRRAVDVLKTEGILVEVCSAFGKEYRFRHSLMREVAWRALLSHQREALLARAEDLPKSGQTR